MIYTIEPGVSFTDTLAAFLLKKYENAPLNLARALIILPTVRAVRSLKEAFIRLSEEKSLLLPRMTSLYAMEAFDKSAEQVPLNDMRRLFLLAKLAGARQKEMTTAQVLALARSLSDFLDEFYQYEIDFNVLETLAPEQFAEHWQETLDFLEIIRTFWPEILKEKNKTDPQEYKIKLLRSLLKEWQNTPPPFPVIMAGFTGGLPVVRDLIAFCTVFDKGLVVLDGLIPSLDEEYFKAIEPTHPQYDLKLLLNSLRLKPGQIRPLPVPEPLQCPPELIQRRHLVYEAMRPAETLQAWTDFQPEGLPNPRGLPEMKEGFVNAGKDKKKEENPKNNSLSDKKSDEKESYAPCRNIGEKMPAEQITQETLPLFSLPGSEENMKAAENIKEKEENQTGKASVRTGIKEKSEETGLFRTTKEQKADDAAPNCSLETETASKGESSAEAAAEEMTAEAATGQSLKTEIKSAEKRLLLPEKFSWPLEEKKTAKTACLDACFSDAPQQNAAEKAEGTINGMQKSLLSALKGVELYTYETVEEEALGIALRLRQVLETPGKTAALVTTDTSLSKRVIAQMKRWGILLDDSAGTPLNRLPVGTFLTLLAQAGGQKDSSYGALLALLKHPLATDGMSLKNFRKKVHDWEKKKRQDKENTPDFSFNASVALEEFWNLFKTQEQPFPLLLQKHLQAAEALARSDDRMGEERLWGGEYGEQISAFLTQLAQEGELLGNIPTAEYPALFESLIGELSLRPKYGMHPRLDILGPIEARLQNSDLMIIGEVNEGTWPKETPANPWMSRPMRVMCALPSLEEKIGLLAHDFVHSFMTKEVVLTRALKKGGTPTLPSRWLLRLQTVLKASGLQWKEKEDALLCFMDKAEGYHPWPAPAPAPPADKRPKSFSATGIELLRSDPYAVYAKNILKLKKLEDLDEPAGLREYGTAVHEAVQAFTALPGREQTFDRLTALGRQALEKQPFDSFSRALFENRFEKTAAWFVKQQEQRLPFIQKTLAETRGEIEVKSGSGASWLINARADRIDILNSPANAVRLIDYKTGRVPKVDEVYYGYAPQLTIEALIAEQGGFDALHSLPQPLMLENPEYWKLSGKKEGGEISQALATSKKRYDLSEAVAKTLEGLKNLIDWYAKDDTPYEVRPNPAHIPSYSDYEALERLGEWGALQDKESSDDS